MHKKGETQTSLWNKHHFFIGYTKNTFLIGHKLFRRFLSNKQTSLCKGYTRYVSETNTQCDNIFRRFLLKHGTIVFCFYGHAPNAFWRLRQSIQTFFSTLRNDNFSFWFKKKCVSDVNTKILLRFLSNLKELLFLFSQNVFRNLRHKIFRRFKHQGEMSF